MRFLSVLITLLFFMSSAWAQREAAFIAAPASEDALAIAMLVQPLQDAADICLIGFQACQVPLAAGRDPRLWGGLDQRQAPIRERAAGRVELAARGQLLQRERVDRLQHAQAGIPTRRMVSAQQALVDQ